LPTVGEILRAEREKQGLTVKDIEKSTSIRALYIQAIEDGKYDVLPGEVYLKGFMRNYATFLGLDAKRILEVYHESQPSPTPPPAPPTTNPALAPKTEQNRSREREGRSSVGRWLIALLVIAIVAGAAWAAMNFLTPSAPQPANPPQAQVNPPAAPPQPTSPPAPQKPAAPAPTSAPIVVSAKYTSSCWTQVVADGRELYEGIPRVGDNMTWNANQSMTVRLGNAAGVELTYNGQPQGRLGGEGDVITRTFAANTTSTTTPR
jgi:cytoskeletal protein RodZ